MEPRRRWTASVSSACSAIDSAWRSSDPLSSSAATRLTGPMRSRSAIRRSCAADSSPAPATSAAAKAKRSGSSGGGHWKRSPEIAAISARRASSLSARADAPARTSRAEASSSLTLANWASLCRAASAAVATANSAAASSVVSRERTLSPCSISRINEAGFAATTARSCEISSSRCAISASRRAASPARACQPEMSERCAEVRSRETASA